MRLSRGRAAGRARHCKATHAEYREDNRITRRTARTRKPRAIETEHLMQ